MKNKNNFLQIEKCVPAYVFNANIFQGRIQFVREKLGEDVSLCYSLKSNPFLVKYADAFDKIEVCSPGELQICLENGVDVSRIVSGGICKTAEEFVFNISNGVTKYSIESERQLALLNSANPPFAEVLLRITSGNQFGMSEDCAKEILKRKKHYPNIKIVGLHYYPGTQRLSASKINNDFDTFLDCANSLEKYGLREIEIGAGVGIQLYKDMDTSVLFDSVCTNLKKLSQYNVTFEGGRFFATDCGKYIVKIIEIRRNGDKTYYITNGGKHQIVYYAQAFSSGKPPVDVVSEKPNTKTEIVSICGALCNEGDILVKDIELPIAQEGDYLVFGKCGAYSITEGIANFLSRDLPAVFIEHDGKITKVRNNTNVYRNNM